MTQALLPLGGMVPTAPQSSRCEPCAGCHWCDCYFLGSFWPKERFPKNCDDFRFIFTRCTVRFETRLQFALCLSLPPPLSLVEIVLQLYLVLCSANPGKVSHSTDLDTRHQFVCVPFWWSRKQAQLPLADPAGPGSQTQINLLVLYPRRNFFWKFKTSKSLKI